MDFTDQITYQKGILFSILLLLLNFGMGCFEGKTERRINAAVERRRRFPPLSGLKVQLVRIKSTPPFLSTCLSMEDKHQFLGTLRRKGFILSPEVSTAIQNDTPIVALESTIVCHGVFFILVLFILLV